MQISKAIAHNPSQSTKPLTFLKQEAPIPSSRAEAIKVKFMEEIENLLFTLQSRPMMTRMFDGGGFYFLYIDSLNSAEKALEQVQSSLQTIGENRSVHLHMQDLSTRQKFAAANDGLIEVGKFFEQAKIDFSKFNNEVSGQYDDDDKAAADTLADFTKMLAARAEQLNNEFLSDVKNAAKP